MKTFARLMCASLCVTGLAAGCEKTTVESSAGKKLTLVKPSNQTITRGETEKVMVAVARTNFEGPVMVRFNDLPRGVSVVDSTSNIDGNERTFVLKAAADADLVKNHSASVTATGPDGMAATEKFEITVKEKA